MTTTASGGGATRSTFSVYIRKAARLGAQYCKLRCEVVGTARFELATYGTQNRRATRLRYAPNEEVFSCVVSG